LAGNEKVQGLYSDGAMYYCNKASNQYGAPRLWSKAEMLPWILQIYLLHLKYKLKCCCWNQI